MTTADKKDARATMRKTHRVMPRPPFERIALVLQGGGALGAYQAGIYQALAEANLHPDWVALGRRHFDWRRQFGAGRWQPAGEARRTAAGILGDRQHCPHGLHLFALSPDQGRIYAQMGQPTARL